MNVAEVDLVAKVGTETEPVIAMVGTTETEIAERKAEIGTETGTGIDREIGTETGTGRGIEIEMVTRTERERRLMIVIEIATDDRGTDPFRQDASDVIVPGAGREVEVARSSLWKIALTN